MCAMIHGASAGAYLADVRSRARLGGRRPIRWREVVPLRTNDACSRRLKLLHDAGARLGTTLDMTQSAEEPAQAAIPALRRLRDR